MAWVTPKTNWYGGVVGGVYEGDYFNATDYNRIKNNLSYLKDLTSSVYGAIDSFPTLGADKNYTSYLYAEEINNLELALDLINDSTVRLEIGDRAVFYANGNTIDYVELNRLESAILDLYENINNAKNGRRKFTWNFGKGEVL